MKARIRSIKPESLLDEKLWDGEQETGLPLFRAFCGLWCHADRNGRFEWRARPLKAGILPYWEGDFSRVLEALAERGFLVRYTVAGREYGLVRTFAKHQVVNQREAQSTLPGPAEAETGTEAQSICTHVQDSHADHTQSMCMHVGKGRERGTEGNGKEQELQVISRKAAAASDPSTIARATGSQPQQSPEKGQEGSPNHGKIPCPADLQLGKDQQSMLGMQIGIEPWAIKAITTSFVCAAMSDQEDKRPHSAWLKCLSKAVSGNWQDPAKRPKREAPDAESQKLAEGFG